MSFSDLETLIAVIVREHFGDVTEKVCRELLIRGKMTAELIARETKLEQTLVQNALIVLLHHNAATFTEVTERGKPKYYYEMFIDGVLFRLRHPRFIFMMKEKHGTMGEMIAEELLTNGNATMERILQGVTAVASNILDARTMADKRQGVALKEVFLQMVGESWIIPSEQIVPDGEEEKEEAGFWKCNHEKFMEESRTEAIVDVIREKFGHREATVARAAVRLSGKKHSRSFTPVDVLTYLKQASGKDEPLPSEEETSLALDLISKSKLGLLTKIGEGRVSSYNLDLDRILMFLRERMVASIIHQKLGADSARIFRLVLAKKQLEQKQIANIAMIPLNVARELLYKMFQMNYLHVQEVPRSLDRAPKRTFYLWSADLSRLIPRMIGEMQKTIRNLKIRLQHHLKQHRDLLSKAEEVQNNPDLSLYAQEKELLEAVQNTEDRLESSIVSVDESLMILCF